MDKLQKGFTLIELLISIVLLSLITIITTSILQNSIIQRNLYMENSNYLEKYNSFFGVLGMTLDSSKIWTCLMLMG